MAFLKFFWSSPWGIAVGITTTLITAVAIFGIVITVLAFSNGPGV